MYFKSIQLDLDNGRYSLEDSSFYNKEKIMFLHQTTQLRQRKKRKIFNCTVGLVIKIARLTK